MSFRRANVRRNLLRCPLHMQNLHEELTFQQQFLGVNCWRISRCLLWSIYLTALALRLICVSCALLGPLAAAEQTQPINITGPWDFKASSVEIEQKGNKVESHFLHVADWSHKSFGFKDGDINSTGIREGDRIHAIGRPAPLPSKPLNRTLAHPPSLPPTRRSCSTSLNASVVEAQVFRPAGTSPGL